MKYALILLIAACGGEEKAQANDGCVVHSDCDKDKRCPFGAFDYTCKLTHCCGDDYCDDPDYIHYECREETN